MGLIRLRDIGIQRTDVLSVRELYRDETMSIALITLEGENKVVRHINSHSVYTIISGSGVFTLNGESFPVGAGDTIYIKPGDTYSDRGKLTMFCVNRPPFTQEDAEIIEQ